MNNLSLSRPEPEPLLQALLIAEPDPQVVLVADVDEPGFQHLYSPAFRLVTNQQYQGSEEADDDTSPLPKRRR